MRVSALRTSIPDATTGVQPSDIAEYLTETTEAKSVCHVITLELTNLRQASEVAFTGVEHARCAFGAGGFQIRDMSNEAAHIVALKTLDEISHLLFAPLGLIELIEQTSHAGRQGLGRKGGGERIRVASHNGGLLGALFT